MGVTFSQFFPPQPTLTEANLPSQKGRVFIVTGGYSGVGLELSTILYQAGGKVYLAGRSEEKGQAAISKIKSDPADAPGEVVFLHLALDDLATVRPAVERFNSLEGRLDVLFNNAAVSNPPQGSVSSQGHELHMATNCLGPYLFTQLLLPTLRRTTETAPSATVRVIWTSSMIVDVTASKHGLIVSDLETPPSDQQLSYTNTKFLASSLATQAGSSGVLSLTQNPGNRKTQLTRHMPWWVGVASAPLLYNPRMGAYTELWVDLSSDVTIQDGGKYVLPWGRLHPSPRPDMLAAMKTKEDGGMGVLLNSWISARNRRSLSGDWATISSCLFPKG
ncbi:MAG: hypothetical protein Q9226_001346 [Calogaya cf. arnoldii]